MPLELKQRHGGKNWYIRGTVAGVAVDETTKTSDRDTAEKIRAKREWEILQGSVFGKRATATFIDGAIGYLEGGGERRFIKKLTDHFGTAKLDQIDQAMIDKAARVLYPDAAPGTLNRQLYAPISAIINHAATRGL